MTTLAYYADGLYFDLAQVSAASALAQDPDLHVVIYTDTHRHSVFEVRDITERIGFDVHPGHYVRKPLCWLDLFQSLPEEDNFVLLDADTLVLDTLHDATSRARSNPYGFAAVVADSSYMETSGLAPMAYGSEGHTSDVESRLALCPENGKVLREYFHLPDKHILERRPYMQSKLAAFGHYPSATVLL